MGQKVRPTGFRTGIMVDWLSRWYASKQDFSELLVEDQKIRKYVKKRYRGSGISKIRIQRTREKVTVYIHSARVGMIIGKKGAEVDKLTKDLEDLVVVESRVDGAPMMKRIQPRARGTAYPIKRRYAHIHVTLSDLEPAPGEQAEAGAEGSE